MAQKSVKKTEESHLALIHTSLENLLNQKLAALPRDFNKTRFLQNSMVVLQDTLDIDKCTPKSVARTMLHGAFLGLDFFQGECYAIPYNKNIGTKQKAKWIKELRFQTDYKGEIKLIKKYSPEPIKNVFAKIVRKSDQFTESIVDGVQHFTYTPKSFSNEEITGVFAVCYFKDNSMLYETMSREEIESVREAYSKAKDSKAWKNSWGEMAKKTVLRRLCKLVQLEFESIEAAQAFEEGGDSEFADFEDLTDVTPIQMPEPIKEIESKPKSQKEKKEPVAKERPEAKEEQSEKSQVNLQAIKGKIANSFFVFKKAEKEELYHSVIKEYKLQYATEIKDPNQAVEIYEKLQSLAKENNIEGM